jgi:uncharacterized membrane protein YgdD (TMEM256/DUF423 family)
MARAFLCAGALSGALAVAAGAFGAHALRGRLEPRMLEIYEVAARYQMYHALALVAVAWIASRQPGPLPAAAGWLFLGGTVVFSGTLYCLSLGGPRWLGAITPLGGVALIGGWLALAAAALLRRSG